jgi:hypothetical protein
MATGHGRYAHIRLGITRMASDSDDFIAQPTEAQGYLVAAQGMLAGALPLENIAPPPVFALTLLCGYSCEAALKAMLAQSGITAADLSKAPYGHDILHLWKSTHDITRSLPSPQPVWVAQLDRVYDKPFHLRYPLGFQAIILPNQTEMLRGTESLVALAVAFVK